MTDTSFPRPPAHIEPFVRVLGAEKALEFLLEYGGAEISFRENPRNTTPVVQLLGRDAVIALSAELLPARIPTAKPWIAQTLRAKGLSVAAIARKLHMSDVAVRRWLKSTRANGRLAGRRADPRQIGLF